MAAGCNFARAFSRTRVPYRCHSSSKGEKAIAMFKRIAVAHSESPEVGRALPSAVHLAKTLDAELRAITSLQAPPAHTAYADAVDPSLEKVRVPGWIGDRYV
jgi:hypothetical protein